MAASLGKRTRSEPSAETPLQPGKSGLDDSSHDGSEFLQAPGNKAFCGHNDGQDQIDDLGIPDFRDPPYLGNPPENRVDF